MHVAFHIVMAIEIGLTLTIDIHIVLCAGLVLICIATITSLTIIIVIAICATMPVAVTVTTILIITRTITMNIYLYNFELLPQYNALLPALMLVLLKFTITSPATIFIMSSITFTKQVWANVRARSILGIEANYIATK